jgi:16S rRNA processing protein RimM
VKTQGRRGELAAELHTDFPELFAERKRVFALDGTGARRELAVEDFWSHKGYVILKFAGVDSISDAETLVGCEVQIPAAERAKLDPDEIYVSDLKDCVVAVEESGGEREIGKVADVIFGAGEAALLVVREGTKEYMIPFAAEYVKLADVGAKRITMALPEGMLDLDAPLSRDEKRRQQEKREE